jgi:hypothetical protein
MLSYLAIQFVLKISTYTSCIKLYILKFVSLYRKNDNNYGMNFASLDPY